MLFVGGYFATVLIGWAVLLIDYYIDDDFGNSTALSILTPAGAIFVGGLIGLSSPFFFFIPASAIVAFSLMAVETTKPKKRVLAISLVVFIGGTAITYAIFGNPAFSVVASSLTLALWLSVGLLLVIARKKFWPSKAGHNDHEN
jgi:cation transporter-like permease